MNDQVQLIRLGHSPDPDDAFMFYAMAAGKISTGNYRFEHQLADIETLNRRALGGQLELTAVSVHAYGHLSRQYAICSCGASMGEGYGPIVVAREPLSADRLAQVPIAVPGRLTSAYLALRLFLGGPLRDVVVPFDQILDAVAAGRFEDQPVEAGLVIHEGQLTYGDRGLERIIDLGQWWSDETDLPLPLGVNALRKDLGPQTLTEVAAILRRSIAYGLEHRQEALEYALQFGRGLDRQKADRFVGMYVNHRTEDLGSEGREAIAQFLARGHAAGLIPELVVPQFVE